MVPALKEGILFLIAGIDTALACFIVLNNPRKIVNWIFATVPLGAAVWAVGLAMFSLTSGSLIWGKIVFGSSFLIFPLLVIFSDAFPDKTRLERWYLWIFLPGLALLLTLPLDLILKAQVIRGFQVTKVTGPLYPLCNIYGLTCLALTTFNLLKKYRKAAAVVRLQFYYLFFGFLVFVIFGLITNLILPALGEPELIMLGPAASLIFITFATYAIVKYRLMDVRDALQRGVVVLSLIAAAPPLLFTIYQLLVQVVPRHSNLLLIASACLTLLILGLTGVRFIPHFLRFTERFFFRGTYVYSEVTDKLVEVFNKARTVEELCVTLTEILVTTFETDKTVFLLKERTGRNFAPAYLRGFIDPSPFIFDSTDEFINYARRRGDVFLAEEIKGDISMKRVLDRFQNYKIDLFIPVEVRGELEGLICLGRKTSGRPYTTRDISLFRVVSDLSGIALENVKLYAALGGKR